MFQRLRHAWRTVRRDLNEVKRNQQNLLALSYLQPLTNHYLPWSSAAIAPADLVVLLNDILIHDRSVVLECGSGISTVFFARLLGQRKNFGHVYTVDHDQHWLESMMDILRQEGLEKYVTPIHAPLVPSHLTTDGLFWYDLKPLQEKLPGEKMIDLLVVDGPPARMGEAIRYPAIPFFASLLSEKFVVALHDTNRAAEGRMIVSWKQHLESLRQETFHIVKYESMSLLGTESQYVLAY